MELKMERFWVVSLPESVENLINLTTIVASYNYLTQLPESIINLSNLFCLNVEWFACQFARIDWKS